MLVVDGEGRTVGAVSLTSDNDKVCALAGVTAAELTAQW